MFVFNPEHELENIKQLTDYREYIFIYYRQKYVRGTYMLEYKAAQFFGIISARVVLSLVFPVFSISALIFATFFILTEK
jgi:hypothetical protein